MVDRETAPLRITPYCFDKRGREILRMTLEGPGDGCALLCEEGRIDAAALFNMDAVSAKEEWITFRDSFPQRPVIIMAMRDPKIEDTIFLAKPVGIEALKKAIFTAKEQIFDSDSAAMGIASGTTSLNEKRETASAQSQGQISKPEIAKRTSPKPGFTVDSALPTSRRGDRTLLDVLPKGEAARPVLPFRPKKEHVYDPQEYLQGQVITALNESRRRYAAMQLNILTGSNEWEQIIFLPGVQKVVSTLSNRELKRFCETPLYLMTFRIRRCKSSETLDLVRQSVEKRSDDSFESFQWKVALWSSNGRVPVGTDFSAPMTLAHWPNLTRYLPVSSMMRIAALLIDQPRSLLLVIKVLNISPEQVFSFYSAVSAVGLIKRVDREVVAKIESEPVSLHRHHSLFGRILSHLKRS